MLTVLEVIVQATGNALTEAVTAAEAEAPICTLGSCDPLITAVRSTTASCRGLNTRRTSIRSLPRAASLKGFKVWGLGLRSEVLRA